MPSLTFDDAKMRVGTPAISALLAAAGGFLDGFTYIGHGHAFANAMTGNVVLLGIECLSGSWQTSLRPLSAILAFMVGISAAQAMQLLPTRRDVSAPYLEVLGLEIGILAGLSLLPAGTSDILFTTSIAFAASVQIETFRNVEGQGFSSTFITGNLRTLAEASFAWFFEGRHLQNARVARTFASICGAFLVGAIAGDYATHAFGNRALWCEVVGLLGIGTVIRSQLRKTPVARSEAGAAASRKA